MGDADEGQTNLHRMILQVVLMISRLSSRLINVRLSGHADTLLVWSGSEIKVALFTLLADGLVAACIIHAEPPYITAVDPNFDTLERYWFMTTDRGEKFLQCEGFGAS